MSKGTPFALKCPKCKRGKYREPCQIKGVEKTGEVEKKLTKSNHRGSGSGGRSFFGYRGRVRCLDCGHEWFSTHSMSGRIRADEKETSP
jgi:hypothetical protein